MQGIRGESHDVGAKAVASAIRSRLLSFQGEWWENEELGIPFHVLVGKMNQEREQIADAYIRERIATTFGVAQIVEYHTEIVGSSRRIHVEVLTTLDEVASVEVVL